MIVKMVGKQLDNGSWVSVPTVVGNASSTSRKSVEGFFGTPEVMYATYEGSPVWCLTKDIQKIEHYWDGQDIPPEEYFT